MILQQVLDRSCTTLFLGTLWLWESIRRSNRLPCRPSAQSAVDGDRPEAAACLICMSVNIIHALLYCDILWWIWVNWCMICTSLYLVMSHVTCMYIYIHILYIYRLIIYIHIFIHIIYLYIYTLFIYTYYVYAYGYIYISQIIYI